MADKLDYTSLLTLARERYRDAVDADKTERTEALDDLKFEHNEDNYQWPAQIRQIREQDYPPRPCLSLNKIPEKIDLVEGEFRQLRPSIKIRGVDSQSDPKIAEIMAGIIRHIEYNSNARSAYNTSHGSVLRCGRGAWRVDIEDAQDDPFVRDIIINRIPNVLTVVWDPSAKKADKSDANYIFITEEITEKEFKSRYSGAELSGWDSSDTTSDGWRSERTIRVAEYWYKETVSKTFLQVSRRGPDGKESITTITEDKRLELDRVIAQRTAKVPQVKWCVMINNDVLEGPYDWPSPYIPIVVEVGRETNIEGKTKTRGMVRHAKTPQQMYNFWSSSATEQIALSPKSPYLVTAEMIKTHQGQWDQANVRNFPYLLFNADAKMPGAGPRRESPPMLSQGISSELLRMEHDIMSAMGIYQASLGDEGQEKSGKAIVARQRQGSMGSYTFTDNFQTALIYSTKIILSLIPHVYDTERIMRIRGEDDTEKTVVVNSTPDSPMLQGQDVSQDLVSQPKPGITEYVNDLSVGKYDVVATIGPSYDTQRTEALEMLLDLAGKIPQFAQATIDLIVKNIDVPGAEELIKRARKLVPVDIRGAEPGEEVKQNQPTFEQMIEMKRLELEGIKEMRESFEGKLDSVAKLMTAEAKEAGQQLSEITAFVEELRARAQMEQQASQGQPIEANSPAQGANNPRGAQ